MNYTRRYEAEIWRLLGRIEVLLGVPSDPMASGAHLSVVEEESTEEEETHVHTLPPRALHH